MQNHFIINLLDHPLPSKFLLSRKKILWVIGWDVRKVRLQLLLYHLLSKIFSNL